MKLPAICGALLLLGAAPAEKKKTDLDRMQGNWKTVSARRSGKVAPRLIQKSRLDVENNTFTLTFIVMDGEEKKEEKTSITVKLDPSKSPKQIDFIDTSGKVDSRGIYKLEGKKLTICFDGKTKPRPACTTLPDLPGDSTPGPLRASAS